VATEFPRWPENNPPIQWTYRVKNGSFRCSFTFKAAIALGVAFSPSSCSAVPDDPPGNRFIRANVMKLTSQTTGTAWTTRRAKSLKIGALVTLANNSNPILASCGSAQPIHPATGGSRRPR
jgi:hypothetical protein